MLPGNPGIRVDYPQIVIGQEKTILFNVNIPFVEHRFLVDQKTMLITYEFDSTGEACSYSCRNGLQCTNFDKSSEACREL